MSAPKTEARLVEIARLAADQEQVASLRVHLEEVLHGEVFGASPRSQQFLRYVVENSINCRFENLKERVIGIEVFHRPPSYDTGEDAIVRVTASDVRKRLLQHYGRYGDGSEFRIDIPPGSYVPEIVWTPPPKSTSVVHPKEVEFEKPEVRSAQVTVAYDTPIRQSKWHSLWKSRWFLAGMTLTLVPVLTVLGYVKREQSLRQVSTQGGLWSAFFTSGRAVEIVYSDPDFATIQDLTGNVLTLSDYANGKYIPDSPAVTPEIRAFSSKYLRGVRAADVDLPIVATIVRIADADHANVSIRSARLMKPADFRTDENFILLGSPLSNPWTELFSQQLDFIFSDRTSLGDIIDLHPKGKELARYVSVGSGFDKEPPTGVSFAIVALVQNQNRLGNILILAGTTSEATAAAAHTVTSTSELRRALRTCSLSDEMPLRSFELLLRVDVMAGSGTRTEVVACHLLS